MLPDLSDALKAAPALLGWKLIHDTADGPISGYVVETEAYRMDDPASHTYKGKTTRNAAMFQAAGTVYVYFTYGMHNCVNIVTGDEGQGQGVLIRALEPVDGIELMSRRRSIDNPLRLTNGPAKLTQALAITLNMSGSHVQEGPLRLELGFTPETIVQTTRIGITRAAAQPWRFYVYGSPYVSKL